MDPASESDQPNQSVFSARSGIQDLLIKPEPQTEAEPVETLTPPEIAAQRKKGKAKKSKRQIARVKRRQENYLHQRRIQKKKQVLKSRLRILWKSGIAALLAFLLWTTAQSPFWVYQEPRFTLQNDRLLQAAQIQPLIEPLAGKPIYAIQPSQLAQTIKNRFDIVDRVWVRRQIFPHQLVLLVQEKHPWAEIYASEKQTAPYALLTPQGVVNLKHYAYRSGQSVKSTLEKITIAPKTTLTPNFVAQLREILWQARQIRGLRLQGADIRNSKRIVLYFQEIPVILGPLNRSASERLSRLTSLTPKINELRDALESVDLRWEEQVTFHKKPTAKIVLTEG